MTLRRALAALGLVGLAAGSLGASCGQTSLGILPGVVNDPKNLSLRRAILAWGTAQLCGEMQRRSIPLRMRDEDPVTGRFYPQTCFATDLANRNLFVQFTGKGYAFLGKAPVPSPSGRIAFQAGGAVEYDHDFLMDGSTMYVYFRQRSTSATSFEVGLVEQPSPLGAQADKTLAEQVGKPLMSAEIARGFTVVRDDDGSVAFGFGIVERGRRPLAPYSRPHGAREILANERTEIHQNQRDYAGPYEVREGESLHLTASVDGASGVDVLVVPRGLGEAWLAAYMHSPVAGPPPGQPILDQPIPAGGVWRRSLAPAAGLYYVVFDNTATAGAMRPPNVALDDRAALVSFAVEVGE